MGVHNRALLPKSVALFMQWGLNIRQMQPKIARLLGNCAKKDSSVVALPQSSYFKVSVLVNDVGNL